MNKRILDMIESPASLKVLSDDELAILANEIREQIILTTSKNGGHVSASLGTVEIILALHSILDCPQDKIVFDVGHQAYAHKLVTGRLDRFDTLRRYDGISGFPKPGESIYDTHPSGHASDSLSVAMGLAKARDLRGTNEKIVAVIGDAAISGGMAFEALNHIGQAQSPMLIILNDNAMSISRNVGALMRHFGYLRASNSYRQTRDQLQEKMESGSVVSRGMLDWARNAKESVKHFFIPQSMVFEQLGILCSAPIDGHDIAALKEAMRVMLSADVPTLMHVVTKKGIGYEPSEEAPDTYHGVGPFDIATGKSVKRAPKPPSYTDVFGEALLAEADADDDVVAITAAMATGTGLIPLQAKHPDRVIDVGIAEEHAVGLASGLAIGGKKPVVCIYSTFMQRAIDQAIIDNALPGLNVVFALDRGGLVGADGPTHHGVFDMAYMRMIPHMRMIAPSDEAELVNALHTALQSGGPFALRYPRGAGEGVRLPDDPCIFEEGKGRTVRDGDDVALLAFGRMVGRAVEAAEILKQEGLDARVVDMRWVKPLDRTAIIEAAETNLIVTVEEGVVAGGVGEGVLEVLSEAGIECPTLTLGIGDEFVEQGEIELLLENLGLDGKGIARRVRTALKDTRCA